MRWFTPWVCSRSSLVSSQYLARLSNTLGVKLDYFFLNDWAALGLLACAIETILVLRSACWVTLTSTFLVELYYTGRFTMQYLLNCRERMWWGRELKVDKMTSKFGAQCNVVSFSFFAFRAKAGKKIRQEILCIKQKMFLNKKLFCKVVVLHETKRSAKAHSLHACVTSFLEWNRIIFMFQRADQTCHIVPSWMYVIQNLHRLKSTLKFKGMKILLLI